jgi:hypothetical protein
MENTKDFAAIQKWNNIPKEYQQKIIDNVFCVNCFVTTIVDYELEDDKFGVALKGKCKKCGGKVGRMVDDLLDM